MEPPARSRLPRGFLLVEAVLAAVVIAVGLVFVRRGFSSHVRALRAAEEYDTLTALARGKLLELEASRIFEPDTSSAEGAGVFEAPGAAYEWRVVATLREEDGQPPTSRLELSVRRATPPRHQVRLFTVWPTDEVPPGWF